VPAVTPPADQPAPLARLAGGRSPPSRSLGGPAPHARLIRPALAVTTLTWAARAAYPRRGRRALAGPALTGEARTARLSRLGRPPSLAVALTDGTGSQAGPRR